MTVFNQLVKANPELSITQIDPESEFIGNVEFVSFNTPTDILVSRWYPGYRVTDLVGPAADEAIALLLGDTLVNLADIEIFRRTLATPGIATSIIGKLFPRANVILKDRKYVVSETVIGEVVSAELKARGVLNVNAVIIAYTHAITRVLAAKGLVAESAEKRTVKVAESYAVSAGDLRRVILTEAMRGIFSESRIQAAVKFLDQEATPQIFGEAIGEMFRTFAFSIPEIKLRLEQFDLAVTMVKLFNLDPERVPSSLQAHPALISLSSIANFMVYAADQTIDSLISPPDAVSELKEACNVVLTVIQSAPSIEVMSLSKYGEFFGETPSSSPDGFRRGLVMYSLLGQTSKMEVVDVYPKAEGVNIALVDPMYVKCAAIAAPINGSLLTVGALHGLANIVADEMALDAAATVIDEHTGLSSIVPQLLTIRVSKSDLVYLALGRAASVAYVRTNIGISNPGAALQILYGCNVHEQWRTAVYAATPTMAFFFDPASVLVYTSKMVSKESKPFPSRSQTVGAQLNRDINYVGDISFLQDRAIEEPFNLQIPVSIGSADPVLLKIMINVLASLNGYDGSKIDRDTAFYSAIKEPGVDNELSLLLKIALAYAELPAQDMQGDKARSWLVVNLAPVMLHPVIRMMAERAVNVALIEAKLDGRRLAPQLREVYNRAYFGTTLAILNRFGKIDAHTVTSLTRAIPTSTLSLQASLILAQLPTAVNGSVSRVI